MVLFSSFYFPLSVTILLLEVRRELYAQCLDELIRETTISCVERGLLMLRLRDEARMTLHAYMVRLSCSISALIITSLYHFITHIISYRLCTNPALP